MVTVSILVVTFNNTTTTEACLFSLNNQIFDNFEVILIDNNSKDDTKELIESFRSLLIYPLKTFYLNRNFGFPGGNNYGLIHASGKYIALLNPDAMADRRWLEELVKAMDTHPEVGICGSKMILYGTDLIDSAGDGYSTSLKGFKRGEGENKIIFDKEEYVFGACAGATLYRRRMLEEIGFFDNDFFLIHEDTDLNFRAQSAGWMVLYVPSAIVYHQVRSSIGHMSEKSIYYTLRNSENVRIKNVPGSLFLRCLPEFIIGMITEFLYFAVKYRSFRIFFQAKRDALKCMPKMIEKRKILLKNKRVSNEYLLGIMTPIWQMDFLKTKIRKFIFG